MKLMTNPVDKILKDKSWIKFPWNKIYSLAIDNMYHILVHITSFPDSVLYWKIIPLGEFEHRSETPNSRGQLPHGSKGFKFGYAQRRCDKDECFQCKLLQEGTNQAHSCAGPHFHKVISSS